ncbi:hypothetical protein CKM354_001183200 [Cercospora kikuchii]|uniref:Uncharacterized protein n=1 Tax=Cercospora kikuchii TaxID=84275 RepID=A0A9P3CXN6_9PEZI|nr:uncharacterized protein CKM354_001183200 [Cercospora kikuchii]GIZ48785.1 hypothetical protein CKM354_001183200 [Cercospora kikuchii]
MPQRVPLILLLLSRFTTSHAHLHVPRYANSSGSVQPTITTFPLPVVVTAGPGISTDTSLASTSNPAVTHGETQAISDSASATTEQSSASSIYFSYVPGSQINTPSIPGSSSSVTIPSNEPTIMSSALASAESGASSIASASFSYVPANSSQSSVRTSSTSLPGSASSSMPTARSTTFLTLYTTIYRSAKSGEAATAGDQPSESTATNGVVSDIGKDSTTTTTIFTTIYAPASGGSPSGSASTSAVPSLGTQSSPAPTGSQPPATSHAPPASPTSTTTAPEKSGSSSEQIPSIIAFSYVPGSTFVTSTKSDTNRPSTADISTIQFSYVPESISSSSSAPSSLKSSENPPPCMGTIGCSSAAEPLPSTTPSKPGGITIIPVDPNATTITITETDSGATQTVTETVAEKTVTVTA